MRIKSYASLRDIEYDIRFVKYEVNKVCRAFKSNKELINTASINGDKYSKDVVNSATLSNCSSHFTRLNQLKMTMNNIRLCLYADFSQHSRHEELYSSLKLIRQKLLKEESNTINYVKASLNNSSPKSLLRLTSPIFDKIRLDINCANSKQQTYIDTQDNTIYFTRFLELSSVVDNNHYTYPKLYIGIAKCFNAKPHVKYSISNDKITPDKMKIVIANKLQANIVNELRQLDVFQRKEG